MRIQELIEKYSMKGKVNGGKSCSSFIGWDGRKPIIEFADGSTSKYERNTCAGYLV